MRKLRLLLAIVVCGALSTACTSDDDGPAAQASDPPSAAACVATSSRGGVLEGRSDDGTSVSALTFRRRGGAVRVGEEVKIVVRITGAGDLAVVPVGPDGIGTRLDWGPEAHSSSNFEQPGDEWGFGVTFDAPGCWTIELERSEAGTGRLEFEVV